MSTVLDESQTRLRLASKDDIAALERLVQLAYRGGKSKVSWKNEHDLVDGPRITFAELADEFASGSNYFFLYEALPSAALAGCIKVIQLSATEAYIGMLAIHPDFQDQGLGRKLIESAEKFAYEKLACLKIKMSVLSARKDLLSWYKRLGYTETGETEPFFGADSGQSANYDGAHFIVIQKEVAAI